MVMNSCDAYLMQFQPSSEFSVQLNEPTKQAAQLQLEKHTSLPGLTGDLTIDRDAANLLHTPREKMQIHFTMETRLVKANYLGP